MKIVLFVNKRKDPGGMAVRKAEAILRGAGAECVVYDGDESVFEGAYAVLSLGGDGTFLRCAKYAAPRGVAILGVHLGHTGYLTRISLGKLDELRHISSFAVRERSMLEASNITVSSAGYTNELRDAGALLAINDFTFSRGMEVQTVSLELEVDGHILGSFLGDGVIISSSTGSTGYALSAGGPVVDPALDGILVTPICAHAFRSHAFVLAPERVLVVEPLDAEIKPIYISADGGKPRRVKPGERVEIRVSKLSLRCLEPEWDNFFDNVRIHRL
jgi:NAD+ kinase